MDVDLCYSFRDDRLTSSTKYYTRVLYGVSIVKISVPKIVFAIFYYHAGHALYASFARKGRSLKIVALLK